MEFEKLKEKVIDTKKIYDGKIVKLRVDTVELPNGNTTTREIVEHQGGVGIIPIDEDKTVYIVRQYRHPFGCISLEIPAGKIDAGEEPMTCGVRELKEETGFSADKYTFLGEFHPTPGFCEEKLYIYMAQGLHRGEQSPDEDEFLNVEKYSLDTLTEMLDKGEVHDAKTAIAVLMAKQILG